MRRKETHHAKRKWIKILLLLVPLCLVVLLGCMHEEDYVGTYTCKHESGKESITLHPNHTFLQIIDDGNSLDSNKGIWHVESNMLVLDGWMMPKTLIQDEEIKARLSVGKKRFLFTYVINNCVIIDDDQPEFNPCKE